MHWTGDVTLLFEPIRELSLYTADPAMQSVMKSGVPELVALEYDNWNGGTTYYSLVIRVPVPIYAAAEDEVERLEGEIFKKIERFQRQETHDFVREVLVQPYSTDMVRVVHPTECQFWIPCYFRLFLSHLSQNKVAVNRLKSSLHRYGICAFVAHEDIKPTKEWQDEIEKALFSMDALAAILVPDFGKSLWTDHEVGVALGRGKVVLPVRYGLDPYGLIAKYQGFQAKDRKVGEVSEAVFRAILENTRTSARLLSCLVEQFVLVDSEESAVTKLNLIDRAEEISSEHLVKIRDRATTITEGMTDSVAFVTIVNQFLTKRGMEAIQLTQGMANDVPF